MNEKTRYTGAMSRAKLAFTVLFLAATLPSLAAAASIYVSPTEGTYGLTDTFIADIRIDNQNECINAAHVEVHYPTDSLRAVDFSKGSSILSLWVEEPVIDTGKGIVTFSGGIPGGYCGRIPGDPVLSNVLGKIVFSVIDAKKKNAEVSIDAEKSAVYLNDGLATAAKLTTQSGKYAVVETPQQGSNPWIEQVGEDKTPPDEFVITIESTRRVFGGNYYAVFTTQDKQSGIDHYEMFERGAWRTVTSPHELKDQYLLGGIQIKAIDKAGNERMGTYIEGSAAPRVPKENNYSIAVLVIVGLLGMGIYMWYWDRKRKAAQQP